MITLGFITSNWPVNTNRILSGLSGTNLGTIPTDGDLAVALQYLPVGAGWTQYGFNGADLGDVTCGDGQYWNELNQVCYIGTKPTPEQAQAAWNNRIIMTDVKVSQAGVDAAREAAKPWYLQKENMLKMGGAAVVMYLAYKVLL